MVLTGQFVHDKWLRRGRTRVSKKPARPNISEVARLHLWMKPSSIPSNTGVSSLFSADAGSRSSNTATVPLKITYLEEIYILMYWVGSCDCPYVGQRRMPRAKIGRVDITARRIRLLGDTLSGRSPSIAVRVLPNTFSLSSWVFAERTQAPKCCIESTE